jgi:hypothetical protein
MILTECDMHHIAATTDSFQRLYLLISLSAYIGKSICCYYVSDVRECVLCDAGVLLMWLAIYIPYNRAYVCIVGPMSI